ncbi:MAG: alpha/beta fold hydrolase [Alphaproteobacteria bacterium]|nr:MAG: alpha/beta fold hydrolase [Alphaproteobacteria bacterium]
MAPSGQKVVFEGAQGQTLAGRLDTPPGKPRGYVLFAHCFTCTKDIFAARRVAEALTRRGFSVLRFDFTGLGHSEGEFANTDFSSNVDDLVAAADHLRDRFEAPAILVGHSLGGAAVLAAAEKIPEAVGVATINAPADPGHITHLFRGREDELREHGQITVEIAGKSFPITRQFVDDLRRQSLGPKIRNLGKALLVFHAPRDQIVGIDNAAEIFTAARHPKSFISLDDADHLLSRREDAVYVAEVLAAWATRYLKEQPLELPKAGPGEVVVREAGTGKFAQIINADGHSLNADEPAELGGTNTGPSPYEFLLAGLGACTSMTLRMYADHRKLDLDRVTVTLSHDKIHAEDCAECETREGKIDLIRRTIAIEGDLTDAQRARLMEIADKCPVHRTLHGEVRVETDLAE